MRDLITPTTTPIPFVPWEVANMMEHREYRRRLAGAVRTLLYRQSRANHRRIHQLQERYSQEMKMLQSPPPTALMENEHLIQLNVDVPGVSRDDIKVQIVPTVQQQYELRVSAKRSFLSIDNSSCIGTNTKCQRYGINQNVVDVFQIHATLHNGVLTVTAPKKATKQSNENVDINNDIGKSNTIPVHEMDNTTSSKASNTTVSCTGNRAATSPKNVEDMGGLNGIVDISVSEV